VSDLYLELTVVPVNIVRVKYDASVKNRSNLTFVLGTIIKRTMV
jgi:hypothetical protein